MRKAAAALATLAGVLILCACSTNAQSQNANAKASPSGSVATPSSTAPASSTPATLPTNNDPLPSDLAAIAAMDAHDASAQSETDRFRYLSYVDRNVKQLAQEWEAASGDPLDAYPTAPLSVDSAPQDILTSAGYAIRVALTQPAKDDAKRVLACSLFRGDGSAAYPVWGNTIDALPLEAVTAKDLVGLNASVAASVVNASPVQTDPVGDKFRVIGWSGTYTDLYGNDQTTAGTGKFYFVEFTDYLGHPATAWLQE